MYEAELFAHLTEAFPERLSNEVTNAQLTEEEAIAILENEEEEHRKILQSPIDLAPYTETIKRLLTKPTTETELFLNITGLCAEVVCDQEILPRMRVVIDHLKAGRFREFSRDFDFTWGIFSLVSPTAHSKDINADLDPAIAYLIDLEAELTNTSPSAVDQVEQYLASKKAMDNALNRLVEDPTGMKLIEYTYASIQKSLEVADTIQYRFFNHSLYLSGANFGQFLYAHRWRQIFSTLQDLASRSS